MSVDELAIKITEQLFDNVPIDKRDIRVTCNDLYFSKFIDEISEKFEGVDDSHLNLKIHDPSIVVSATSSLEIGRNRGQWAKYFLYPLGSITFLHRDDYSFPNDEGDFTAYNVKTLDDTTFVINKINL